MYFDFLIPRRPVSLQTKNRTNLQAWKSYVNAEAAKTWSGRPYSDADIQLTLVYLYERDPVDTDNIVKPIQDALVGLVYEDDLFITDVESHRRPISGTFDLGRCPDALIQGIYPAKIACMFECLHRACWRIIYEFRSRAGP